MILISNAVICGFDIRTWILTALHAIVVLTVAFLVALPFNSNFVAMVNGISITLASTPVYQLIILFGISMGYILTRFVLLKETRRQSILRRSKNRYAHC